MPRLPAIDEMLTIAGRVPALSMGRKARVVSVSPKKLTSKIRRIRSGLTLAKCPVAPIPALLTRMSNPPKWRCAASTMRWRSAGLVTSAWTVSRMPPCARTRWASAASKSALRAAASTRARAAAASANAWPMPCEAPVIRMRAPSIARRCPMAVSLPSMRRWVAGPHCNRPANTGERELGADCAQEISACWIGLVVTEARSHSDEMRAGSGPTRVGEARPGRDVRRPR